MPTDKRLKGLWKNKKAVQDYWREISLSALHEYDINKEISSGVCDELYTNTWIMTVKAIIELSELANWKKKTVLEVGCGYGRIIIGLKKFLPDLKIVGVDIVKELLGLAKIIVTKEANEEDVTLGVGDAESLPFKDNTFDAVFSVRVLQYVPNPLVAVNEFKRVVKNNGKIIVILPNKLNLKRVVTYHTKLYSPFEVKRWFEDAGLLDIKIGSFGFIPIGHFHYKSPILILEVLRKIPLLKYFGGLLVVSGTKVKDGGDCE